MYFLRSNRSGDNRESENGEIDLTELLNNDVIKSVFSDIVKKAVQELNAKVSDLQEEVVMLRESNIELIHLLTNGESINNQSQSNDIIKANKSTSITKGSTVNSTVGSNINKNDSDKLLVTKTFRNKETSMSKEKTTAIRRPTKPETKPVEIKSNGSSSKNTNNKGKHYNKSTKPVMFGTGTQNTSKFTAVSRKSWLYVGRVTPGTGVTGIKNHVDETFPGHEFEIEMLPKWKDGKTESFKVGIDYDLLDEAYISDNWPKGSLIKKYSFFRD